MLLLWSSHGRVPLLVALESVFSSKLSVPWKKSDPSAALSSLMLLVFFWVKRFPFPATTGTVKVIDCSLVLLIA